MPKPRNWHCVNAILRRSDTFQMQCIEPVAEDFECIECGEYLDPDGQCPECDEDEDHADLDHL